MRHRFEKLSQRMQPFARGAQRQLRKRPAASTVDSPASGGAALAAVPAERPRALGRFWSGSRLAFVLAVVLPTALAGLYFGVIASDRYVSESTFIVRSAKSPLGGGLGGLLQIVGFTRSQDDTYSVQEYILSRDAVAALSRRLPLRDMFNPPGADFLSRYPNPFHGTSEEELYQYYKSRVEVVHNTTTALTSLKVQAFRAEDALTISRYLLALGEDLVNRMNERIRNDAVRFSEVEVARAQDRLVETQIAITDFRNRELMLDPSKSSLIVAELIGRLATELAASTAQLREVQASSPDSPQIPSVQRRIAALEGQITLERQRVSSASDGLAEKIAGFERLNLQREFAVKALASAATSLELARNEARRQQLYLERVVEPALADSAGQPRRLRSVLVIFGASVLLFFVGWLIWAGVREHHIVER